MATITRDENKLFCVRYTGGRPRYFDDIIDAMAFCRRNGLQWHIA